MSVGVPLLLTREVLCRDHHLDTGMPALDQGNRGKARMQV